MKKSFYPLYKEKTKGLTKITYTGLECIQRRGKSCRGKKEEEIKKEELRIKWDRHTHISVCMLFFFCFFFQRALYWVRWWCLVYPARAPHGRRPPTGSGMITNQATLLFFPFSTLFFEGYIFLSSVSFHFHWGKKIRRATAHTQLTQQREKRKRNHSQKV